jgi:hypothetical protein
LFLSKVAATPELTTVAGPDEEAIMLVEHREIGASRGCSLFVIRASSVGPDCCSDLGDSLPFADVVTPIVFNGFETIGDTFARGWRSDLTFILIHE